MSLPLYQGTASSRAEIAAKQIGLQPLRLWLSNGPTHSYISTSCHLEASAVSDQASD
jgi:hypothetical protein